MDESLTVGPGVGVGVGVGRAVGLGRRALLVAVVALAPALARADAPAPDPRAAVVVVIAGDPSPAADVARASIEAHARAAGHALVRAEAVGAELSTPGAVPPSAVAELEAALEGLSRARALAGRLEEPAALTELARARGRIDGLLALPGASRWAAEVAVAVAIVAHQIGATALAERSMRAAATLDGARAIGSAEAPPELVARARAIAEEVAVGPRGSFVVTILAPGARAYLDEVPLEPIAARAGNSVAFRAAAPVGEHVLRVEAEGHRAYASRLEVFEGERAPVAVRLSREPRAVAAERAIAAGRRGDVRAVVAELAGAELPFEVWVAMASPRGDRSLLSRCRAQGCAATERLDGGGVAPSAARSVEGEPFADRAFLVAEPSRPRSVDTAPRRRRALLYGAAALAVAGGVVTAAVLATRPDDTDGLAATIDFGGLGLTPP